MILNRYGHTALNGWDGNSIQLNTNGDTILAPQVGAGSKDSYNRFNGVLMGSVKSGDKTQTGLFGYNAGQRSIFLDSDTGNAYFGKNTDARINIGADKVGIAPRGSIYSSGYYNYNTNGEPASTASSGMLIDLITPEIRFGSGHFSVDKDGNLIAKGGGKIAGWKIGNDALTSDNDKVYLRSQNYGTSSSNKYAIYSNGTFSVTPEGLLHSVRGDIAGWTIGDNTLSKGGVTINSDNSNASNYAFRANNSAGTRKFSVDYNGNLYSKSGTIAGWTIGDTNLTNGDVGLGTYVTNINSVSGDGTGKVTAKIWSGSGNEPNFAVSNNGYIYSKAGKIGGWTITDNKLSGGNTVINSNGSLSNSGGGNGTWAINNDGSSTFNNMTVTNLTATTGTINGFTANNITANNGGQIGGWTINSTSLSSADKGMYINAEGSMSGPSWYITKSGQASFTNVIGLSGTLGSGNSLSGGSGSDNWNLGYSGGSVGGCPFGSNSVTGGLAVDTLEVGGKKVTWQ